MRSAFIKTLIDLAREDRRIMLIVGDLGFGVVEPFRDQFPDQFLNAGVAEQNMVGIAAGMALSGRVVFVYSIANFPTLRPLEQVRNDVCYNNASVVLVSVGGGMSYGSLGPTHHATEDIAVMRAMPNMMVVAPGDPLETRLATRALAARSAPAYLRLGRDGEPVVHLADPSFALGHALTVRPGADLTLIATGGMLAPAMGAAGMLAERGLDARVLSMHTVKPLDVEAVLAAARETRAVFTVEEHNIIGGLGSAVAETLAESGERPAHFRRIGLPDQFSTVAGTQDYLRSLHGLDPEGICRTVCQTMGGCSGA